MNISWLFVHLLPTIGFILALALMAHILRERRSPASTFAWLLAVVFIPYLAVPLYLVFGGRKMLNKAEAKPDLGLNRRLKPPVGASRQNARILSTDGGVFPVSENNRIRLLPTGEEAFRTILELIENARQSVCVATFILGQDKSGNAIVHALARKAAQGVRVRLLLDALGSVKVRRAFLTPLLEAGGGVAFFMPMIHLPFRGRANLRNHRKLLICDNQAAVLGGMNLASEYMGHQCPADCWRDLSLLVQGPVVDHITRIFKSDWTFADKAPADDLSSPGSESRSATEPGDGAGGGRVQLVASGPDVPDDSLRNAILTEIFGAKARIWIVTPYFVPDEAVFTALLTASERAINVTIILPDRNDSRLVHYTSRSYFDDMLSAGVNVFVFKGGLLHTKSIVIDRQVVLFGSVNLDVRSFWLDFEVTLGIYDSDFTQRLLTLNDKYIQDAVAVDLKTWRQRPRIELFFENMARLASPLL